MKDERRKREIVVDFHAIPADMGLLYALLCRVTLWVLIEGNRAKLYIRGTIYLYWYFK